MDETNDKPNDGSDFSRWLSKAVEPTQVVIGPELLRKLAAIGQITAEMATDGDRTTLGLGRLVELRDRLQGALAAFESVTGDRQAAPVVGDPEAPRRHYWAGHRKDYPATRTPLDWVCEARTGPEEGAGFDWAPENFPDITAQELDLLGIDVMDSCLAGPDPVDKFVKGVRAYFAQNPY